jgi:hypothetical protein
VIELRCSPKHPSCWPAHRQLVDEYRAARHADEQAMEQATALYPTEVAEYRRDHHLITFKEWLIGSRGRRG